ncbi:MAG: hypothetical protein DRP11_02690 [Candidatus Aenigmatarchaeota archaeon]|nr:MAG: hypothetical protein DRP11_02690 [Candidatus Aenigmarchaeota archaeon]
MPKPLIPFELMTRKEKEIWWRIFNVSALVFSSSIATREANAALRKHWRRVGKPDLKNRAKKRWIIQNEVNP